MKLATWNVNSLRKRAAAVAAWIERERPDALCLQETKVSDEDFPVGLFRECGMQIRYHGQKAYNGVAIASYEPLEEVEAGLPGMAEEGQARLLAATVAGVRIVSAYIPNGGDPAKYKYKLEWLGHFAAFMQRQRQRFSRIAVGGDYNVAPDDSDVYDLDHWGRDSVAVRPAERAAWRKLLEAGYEDAHAACGGQPHAYTWWDYRRGAFERNHGLRIDHFLLAGLACRGLEVDSGQRRLPDPSDHAPVICLLAGLQGA